MPGAHTKWACQPLYAPLNHRGPPVTRRQSHTHVQSHTHTATYTSPPPPHTDWGAKLRIVPENATKNTEYPAALAWAPKAFHTISWPEQIEVQSVLWKRLKLGRSQHKKQRKAVTPQHPPSSSIPRHDDEHSKLCVQARNWGMPTTSTIIPYTFRIVGSLSLRFVYHGVLMYSIEDFMIANSTFFLWKLSKS